MVAVRKPTTAEKAARRAEAATFAGVRQATFSRQTGTLVLVVDGALGGLDTDDGAAPWSTVCDDHSHVICHETIQQAYDFAPVPGEWCEHCMAEAAAGRPLDDDEFDLWQREHP